MSRFSRRQSRRAVDVFKKCPRCGSPNVIKVEDDVLCTYCDWSSLSIDVPIELRMASIPVDSDSERARPGSLAEAVEKILQENPFLTGEPIFV